MRRTPFRPLIVGTRSGVGQRKECRNTPDTEWQDLHASLITGSVSLGLRAARRVPDDDVESGRLPGSGGIDMAVLEQRVTRLEERSEAQIATMDYLRQDMSDLRRSMETLATELRSEMAAVRTEMASLSRDLRGEMAALRTELRGEMAEMRASFDRRFTWLVGLMVTGFVVTIGTIAGAFWGVLQSVR